MTAETMENQVRSTERSLANVLLPAKYNINGKEGIPQKRDERL